MASVTAQIPDTVELAGGRFAVAGVHGSGLFDPAEHGLQPAMISTACWRGYVCSYAVVDDRLLLRQLQVGPGSTIGGQPVEPGTQLLGGAASSVDSGPGAGCTFPALDWPVPFTGGLLLGADFVPATYVHMGFHPAWKYARVVELLVDRGSVHARHDRSAEVAELRERIQAGTADDPDRSRSGMSWIERTFTLDYSRTFPGP